jgi:hypothetical protein
VGCGSQRERGCHRWVVPPAAGSCGTAARMFTTATRDVRLIAPPARIGLRTSCAHSHAEAATCPQRPRSAAHAPLRDARRGTRTSGRLRRACGQGGPPGRRDRVALGLTAAFAGTWRPLGELRRSRPEGHTGSAEGRVAVPTARPMFIALHRAHRAHRVLVEALGSSIPLGAARGVPIRRPIARSIRETGQGRPVSPLDGAIASTIRTRASRLSALSPHRAHLRDNGGGGGGTTYS